MSDSKSASSGGIGLFGAVFIVFLVLKLSGIAPVSTWSWLWVTSPLWIGIAFVAVICGVGAAFIGIAALMDKRKQKRGW